MSASGAGRARVQERRSWMIWAALRAHAPLGPAIFATWVTLTVLTTALPLVTTVLIGRVIGAIPDGRAGVTTPLLVLVVVQLVEVPMQEYRYTFVKLLGERYRLAHRERLMSVVLTPPGVAHLHDPDVLDAARAADNAWVKNMLEGITNVFVMRVIGVGSAVIVAVYSPIAAVLLAAAWIAIGRFNWRLGTEVVSVMLGRTQELRRATAIGDLGMLPPAAKEVRIFGLRDWLAARYAAEWWSAMNAVWRQRARSAHGALRMSLLLFGAHVVALALIVDGVFDGRISLTGLAMVVSSIHQMRELGEGVFGHFEVEFGIPIVTHLAALERLVAERAEPLPGTAAAPSPHDSIRLEGVRFRYPGTARDVLTGVDLEVPIGTSLAIVGENGAGKTTLVQLLARLRDPTGGRITVDGVDLREIDARAWHGRVAAVFQQALRLPLSVSDNITGGRELSTDKLGRAAAGAGAAALIDELPHGWDTLLSRQFSEGMELSGGQWQRLALARGLAALDAGAEVLVLDEPTAHLDVRAEADLYDRFLELTRGHTTVLVSHRFSTVRRATRIAVVEDGRVIEVGSHEELMTVGGRYAEMFSLQASRFVDVEPVELAEVPDQ